MKCKRLLLMLLVALMAPWAAMGQNTLTVCDGTNNSEYVPFEGYNADAAQHNQMIFPATDLTAMNGKVITQMVFYIDQSASNGSNTSASRLGTWTVSLGETTATTLSGLDNTTTLTQVYQGYFDCSSGTLTLPFTDGYTYHGGNLLVDLNHAAASWNRWYFLGVNQSGVTAITRGSNYQFLPKTTFTYETPATCPKPTGLTCTTYTATTATLGWTENGEATQWELEYSTDNTFAATQTTTVSNNPTTQLTGLTAETTYYARVRALCSSTDQSDWSSVCEFKPSAALYIGDGTSTGGSTPLVGNYKSSYDQMIYTASQLQAVGINAAGSITKIGFNSSAANTIARNVKIYMGHTDKTSFSNNTDFIAYNDLTLVYDYSATGNGQWNITAGWNEFELDTPFDYDGNSNLVIAMHCGLASDYSSSSFYYTATSSNQVVYAYSDSYDPVPGTFDPSSYSGSKSTTTQLPNLKLFIEITSTPKPTHLTVSGETASSATVSWQAPTTATPTGYEYQYSADGGTIWTTLTSTTETSVNLPGLRPNTEYTFQVKANYTEGDSDFAQTSFTTLATCLVPEGLAVSNMEATWTAGTATQWNLQYKKSVDTEWTLVSGLTDATYDFANANLDAITNYDVQVQTDCSNDDLSDWSVTVSFTTPCATYDIPYTYDFEAEAPFACWTPITGVTRGNSSSNAHNSTYYLRFAGTTSNLVALPQFNEATNNLRVEFWTRPESNTNSSCGTFSVGYMTDINDASTFIEVDNYAYNDWTSATYEKKTVDFVNAPATANIAFRHNAGSSSWYWFADDVTVKLIPSCLAPSGLSANASTNSAVLSWTANSGETAWTVYYKKTTDETYTEVANATNPYTLNGLDAATNYQYYVVANCSADDASEASEVFPFVTECDVIDALGYSENFDGYTVASNYTAPSARVLPSCWNAINTTTYSSYMQLPSIYYYSYTNYANTTPNCLKFYSSYSSYSSYDPQPQYAILPEMSSLAGKEVVLYARGYNTSSTFKIGTMSDPEDANTFSLIEEQTGLTTSYQKFSYIIPAECTDSYLAIMIDAANSSRTTNGVYIDDITVKEMVTVDADEIVAANPSEGQMTWSQFAQHVNNGDHFTSNTITLMEDIIITEMVGTAENPFTGTFDGNGKTITADITSGETAAAPFHYIKDATIKNLTMTGSVTETATTSDGYHAGGLVGYAWSGYNIIENCRVSTNVTIAGYGGGIVGHGKTSVVFLKGCVYDGTITNALNVDGNNKGVGGLVGWFDGGAALNIHDSYYNGTYSENEGVSVYFHPVACKTGGASVTVNIYDCYYICDNPAADSDGTNNVVTNAGQKAYTVTGAEGITVDLPLATIHYSCSGIYGDNNATWNGIKIGDDIYGGEDVTLALSLSGANGYEADHGTLTPISTTYTLLMEAYNTTISGVDCPVPYNVAVPAANLMARSAQVTWNGGSDSYTVEYGEVVDVPTTYDFEDQTIPTIFTNSETYAWTVTSDDKHEGTFSIKSGGAGTAYATSDLTLTLTLTDNAPISFWYKASSEANYDYGRFLIDGSQKFQTSGTSNEWTQYTGELTAGTHTLIWRYYKDSGTDSGDDCFYVDDITITSSAVETWTTLSNITTASPYTIENLNPETTYQVKVSGTCAGTETEYSDVVSFTTPASCIVPTGLAVSNVTTNSAYASWTAGGSETQYVVAYKKATDADWTVVENRVDQTFYTLSNLDPATDYEVRVQSYCDADDQSDWTDAVSFTTECEAVTSFPWSENFNSLTAGIPTCWDNSEGTTTDAGYRWNYYASGHEGAGLRFNSFSNSNGFTNFLKTPTLSLPANEQIQLSFWWKNPAGGDFSVYISTDGGATYETALATGLTDQTAWTQHTISLTDYAGQDVVIVFKGTSNWGYGDAYIYLDDVEITYFFTKTIEAVGEEGWESGKGGYYLIASPVSNDITPTEANGFIPATVANYDLYYFSQAGDGEGNEWINFKDETLGGYDLTNGKGYLYASKEGTTLTFTGTPGTNGNVPLDNYNANARFNGWNLIGNPLAQDAYINKPFYTLENSDTYTSNTAVTAIQPMQGVLIIADAEETTVNFSTEAPAAKNSKLNMNLRRANKQLDNAILVFGGDQQLGKMTFRANSSKIFMPVEGKDYAITSVEGQVGEVPVSFKAENNGTYSLSFTSEEVTFSYLHLIDNMTGNDVNLLQTPSYTFDARTTDYESRFRLVFATGSSTGSDTFGFVNASGNFCIFGIEGEATVQVIDVLGHVISSETFSGSYERKINGAPGVYMVRLIQGNDVKVQKVVVR